MPNSSGSFRAFVAPSLDAGEVARLNDLAREARGDILTMTTLAQSGHPGGSMSSIEMYLTVWAYADVAPDRVADPGRDRIVVSHGHTSPGAYAALGRLGFVDLDGAVAHFRQAGTLFEGHVERALPGIEWSTGNLGQGLSAAVGMALAGRLTGHEYHTFCLMGDGGQAKGQHAESRRFAKKYGLARLTAVVDTNDIEQSGPVHDIMPEDIRAHWEAAGWSVLEVDGHDVAAIYAALHEAVRAAAPTAILCHTTIGKGVPFMEGDYQWHGKGLPEKDYVRAMEALGLEPRIDEPRARRAAFDVIGTRAPELSHWAASVEAGEPRTYAPDVQTDNRSAWGAALADIGDANIGQGGRPRGGSSPIAVFDCDLVESVKTEAFRDAHPENFFEAGIQEHSTAATAGALSTQGVLTFWADFGVFGVGETYNQHRLSDINAANLKLAITHCGIDVGEDGKTHHCIDYVGTLRNCFGWRVVVPCDPNQTDRATRWMAREPGCVAMAMGRAKLPVVTLPDGTPAFGGDWRFEYGRATVLREGGHLALLTMGSMTHRAVRVHEILAAQDIGCRVVDVATPLALDEEMMPAAAATPLIVTYEDHHPDTGLGGSVALWLAEAGEGVRPGLLRLGVSHYESSGKAEDLTARQGLDAESVAERILGTLRAPR